MHYIFKLIGEASKTQFEIAKQLKKGYGTGLIYETGLALNLDAKFYFGFGLIFCQVSQGVAQLQGPWFSSRAVKIVRVTFETSKQNILFECVQSDSQDKLASQILDFRSKTYVNKNNHLLGQEVQRSKQALCAKQCLRRCLRASAERNEDLHFLVTRSSKVFIFRALF